MHEVSSCQGPAELSLTRQLSSGQQRTAALAQQRSAVRCRAPPYGRVLCGHVPCCVAVFFFFVQCQLSFELPYQVLLQHQGSGFKTGFVKLFQVLQLRPKGRYSPLQAACQVLLQIPGTPGYTIFYTWFVRTLLNKNKCTPSSTQPSYSSAAQRSAVRCGAVRCRASPCGGVLCRAALCFLSNMPYQVSCEIPGTRYRYSMYVCTRFLLFSVDYPLSVFFTHPPHLPHPTPSPTFTTLQQ